MRDHLGLLIASFLLLIGSAGCTGVMTTSCNPACAAGTHCTVDGCVADSVVATDMAVSVGPDFAGDPCRGTCGGSTPKCKANGVCVACLVDGDCAMGMICQASENSAGCVPGCKDDSRCGGMTPNCCGGHCIDKMSDAANCGACDKTCNAPHAASTCAAGACKVGACAPGWGDCDHDPTNGCEGNLHIDPLNCGKCGTKCEVANGAAGCSDGCYLKACNFGFDDCNGDPTDGCETSVLSDARNCGSCGLSCQSRPNANVTCVNANCAIQSCKQGFLDCDKDPANGCEVIGATDPNNCGACGAACPMGLICRGSQCTCPNCNFPNASSRCVNNMCILDKCNPGFADCDGNPKNGCEVATDSDAMNCGKCGNVCPMNAKVCFNSMCIMSPCIGNPQWQRVTCTTSDWVWSSNSGKAQTLQAAAAAHVLETGCMHGVPQPALGQGVCSLDGMGWVSSQTWVMLGCNNSWWHIGGRFSGQCGGHDGDVYRHLVLTDNDCYQY